MTIFGTFFFKIASIFVISTQYTTTYSSRSMPARIWRYLMFRQGYVALFCNPYYSDAEQRPFRWAKYHATVKYHTSQTLDAMWEILSNGKLQSVLRRSFAPLTGGSRRIGSQLGSDHGEEQHHEEIAQVLCTRYLPLRGKGREAIHSRIWGKSCRPAGGNNNNKEKTWYSSKKQFH